MPCVAGAASGVAQGAVSQAGSPQASIDVELNDHSKLRLPIAFARQHLPGHQKKPTAVVLPELNRSFNVHIGWAGQALRLYHIFGSGWRDVVKAGGFECGDILRITYVSATSCYSVVKVGGELAGAAAVEPEEEGAAAESPQLLLAPAAQLSQPEQCAREPQREMQSLSQPGAATTGVHCTFLVPPPSSLNGCTDAL